MITQRMMSSDKKKEPEYWTYTVNTEAITVGSKTSAVPLNLYEQPGITMTVDWGDGTTSTLTSADYASNDSTASVHEYAEAGIYTISIGSTKWEKAFLLGIYPNGTFSFIGSNINNVNSPLYWFQRTLIELPNILPKVAGTTYITSAYSTTFSGKALNNFSRLFAGCSKLTAITSDLLKNNTHATSFYGLFQYCASLTMIPDGLLDYNTNVTQFNYCFSNCVAITNIPSGLFRYNTNANSFAFCFQGNAYSTALTDFTIHIGSPSVTNASDFVSQKVGTIRTVYVPAGSTTETTFNNIALACGLTIIGE